MFTKYSHMTTEEVFRLALRHEEIPQLLAHELLMRLEACMDELDLWETAFGSRAYVEEMALGYDA